MKDISKDIIGGKIGVIPTDTIYGLVCSALNPEAVERLYRVRKRDPRKPCIVLISDASELSRFGIPIPEKMFKALGRVWPGAVSVILDCPDEQFTYLHRGTKTLAFRVPADKKLRDFLKKTGPLLAPSANPEGKPHAKTIKEAKKYFGDSVDFYIDGGEMLGSSSTLARYENGKLTVLRQGGTKIS